MEFLYLKIYGTITYKSFALQLLLKLAFTLNKNINFYIKFYFVAKKFMSTFYTK